MLFHSKILWMYIHIGTSRLWRCKLLGRYVSTKKVGANQQVGKISHLRKEFPQQTNGQEVSGVGWIWLDFNYVHRVCCLLLAVVLNATYGWQISNVFVSSFFSRKKCRTIFAFFSYFCFFKKAVMQSVFKKNAKKAVVELRSSSNVAAAVHLIEVCNLRFILMILKEKMASL